jgi:sterol 14-demethylase
MLNDDQVVGMLIALLFAGQHTSSTTSFWFGMLLARNKDHPPRLRAEISEVLARHGDELSYDALNEMVQLDRALKEALRLYPPLIMLMRKVKKDITFVTKEQKEYVIPAGHILCAAPGVSHYIPETFPNPDKFDPDRFAPGREEDEKHRYAFIGFGGGRHKCIGFQFAPMQIKTVWSILLQTFEFDLITPYPDADYRKMVVGPVGSPMMVRFRRIQPRGTQA